MRNCPKLHKTCFLQVLYSLTEWDPQNSTVRVEWIQCDSDTWEGKTDEGKIRLNDKVIATKNLVHHWRVFKFQFDEAHWGSKDAIFTMIVFPVEGVMVTLRNANLCLLHRLIPPRHNSLVMQQLESKASFFASQPLLASAASFQRVFGFQCTWR